MEISSDEYIKELEKALIFMCECYVKAKEQVACREKEGENDERYFGLYMTFPIIQGSVNMFAVEKIASLRTKLGNKEGNKMSMHDIFEKMHDKRETEEEIRERIESLVKKRK